MNLFNIPEAGQKIQKSIGRFYLEYYQKGKRQIEIV